MRKIVLWALSLLFVSGCADLLNDRPCVYKQNKISPVIHVQKTPRTEKLAAVIYFADGSSNLNNNEKQILQRIAEYATKHQTDIKILGHASKRTKKTSAVEHTMINLNISSRRALKVVETLANYGIPLHKMRYEALADSRPAEFETNARAEALNRRVEIFYMY